MRICNVNIKDNKAIVIGLRAIYGVGPTIASKICEHFCLDKQQKAGTIPINVEEEISNYVEQTLLVEDNLRAHIIANVKKKIAKRSYEGERWRKRLPVRGQRTKTNSRTARRELGKIKG